MSPASGFTTIGTEPMFQGRMIQVELQQLEGPGGERFQREMVRTPGSVATLPLAGDDVILIRMPRVPVGSSLLEIPAGLRDVAGEEPEATARRECEEEIGYRPGRLTLLGTFYNSPGYSDELTYLFLGEDLQPVDARPDAPEEHAAEVVQMGFEEAMAMAQRGEIVDGKTLLAIYAVAARRT